MTEAGITLQQNKTDCIISSANIGETIYHNLCTQSSTVVEWGTIDWIGFGSAVLLMSAFLLMLLIMMAQAIFRRS